MTDRFYVDLNPRYTGTNAEGRYCVFERSEDKPTFADRCVSGSFRNRNSADIAAQKRNVEHERHTQTRVLNEHERDHLAIYHARRVVRMLRIERGSAGIERQNRNKEISRALNAVAVYME